MLDRTDGGPKPVLLRHQDGYHLASADNQRVENLGLGVPQWTNGWTNGVGEVGQYGRVEGIGLRQRPSGLGKVSHLAWIDYDYGQRCGRQGCHRRQFQAARSLQHYQCRSEGLEPGDQFPDSRLVIGDGPPLA